MAFFDHTYANYPFELSSYGKKLDSAGRQVYVNKLIIHHDNGQVFFIPDPYFLKKEDWKSNIENFPPVNKRSIEKYLDTAPGKSHRPRSSYDYVTSGKVQDVKVFVPSGHPEYAVLSASVQRSQRCNLSPHKPWVICKEDGDVKTAHCTCLAGFGEVCSHVFAVLYQVNFAVFMGLTTAATEKPCQWNQSFPQKVPCAALKDITFERVNWTDEKKKRRKIKIGSPAKVAPLTEAEFADLNKFSANSVVFTLFGGDSSETDTADSDDDELDLPPTIAQVISLKKVEDVSSLLPFFKPNTIHNLEMRTRSQRSKLWYKHRCGRLTASNFGDILRRRQITPSFVDTFCEIPEKEVNSPSCRWGRANEVKGFQCYKNAEKDKHVNFSLRRAGLFISSTDPYLGCSPDGYISCDCCGSGVLEVKCPIKYKNVDPRNIAAKDKNFYLDAEGCLKEKHKYYAQVQGQMAVTNTDYCDFVVWTKTDILTIRIRRDHNYWDEIKNTLKSFYFRNVIPRLQSQ